MKTEPISDVLAHLIICPKCGGLYPGVKYRVKRNRAIITALPKGRPTCMKCIEARIAA